MKQLVFVPLIFFLLIGCGEEKTDKNISESRAINNSIIEYDNHIGELCNYGGNLEKLTEAQKIFYLNQNLEREVNNGGFHQYFYNSSGDFAGKTVDGLIKIGAVKTASILRNAIEKFPGKVVPEDNSRRIALLSQIEKGGENIWEEIDEAFLKYEEDLNALNYQFIQKNKKDFEFRE
jgi:hypothetical protein